MHLWLDTVRQQLTPTKDYTLHRLHLRVRGLYLAVLERPRELELRWFTIELVDHGSHALAGDGFPVRVSSYTQRAGKEASQPEQEGNMTLMALSAFFSFASV